MLKTAIAARRTLIAGVALCLVACGAPAGETVRVSIETTEGDIVLELYPERAPVTTVNFLRYVDEGHYDGAHFYRATRPDNDPMITVIQGGLWAPWTEGTDAEFEPPFAPIAHETTETSGLSHTDGIVSMARNEPGTASSEIFITIGDNASLDYGGERNRDGQGFAAFGKVVDGMDAVRAINAAPTQSGEGFEGQLLVEPVEIVSVSRIEDQN